MSDAVKKVRGFLGRNSHVILTGLAITGTVGTAVLASRDTLHANDKVLEYKMEHDGELPTGWEFVKVVGPCYIPTAMGAGATIVAIVGAHQTANAKIVAYSGAYTMAQQAASMYRDRVREVVGEKKLQEIETSYAESRVKELPKEATNVILADGEVLCIDDFTGRPFKSTVEKIRKAQNDANFEINQQLYVSLNDLYDRLGLKPVGVGDDMGWNSDHLIELGFSSALTEDNIPCLVVSFRYPPKTDFRRLH